jgi:hypothetical protein
MTMIKEIFGEARNPGGSEDRGIFGEDRARGWKQVDASQCPQHVLDHIRAVRQAHLEMREPPAFVRSGIADPSWTADAIKRLSEI